MQGTKVLARVSLPEYRRLYYEAYIKEISDEEVEKLKLRMDSILSKLEHKNADKFTGLYVQSLLEDDNICKYDLYTGEFSWMFKTKDNYHHLTLLHNCNHGLWLREIKFNRALSDQKKVSRMKLPFGPKNDPKVGEDLIEELEYQMHYSRKFRERDVSEDNNSNDLKSLSDRVIGSNWDIDIKDSYKEVRSSIFSNDLDDKKLDKNYDDEISSFLEEGDEDDLNLRSSDKLIGINSDNIIDNGSDVIKNQMVDNSKLDFKPGFINLFSDNYRGKSILDYLENGTRMLCVQDALKKVKLKNNQTVFEYIVNLLSKNNLLDVYMEDGISSSVDEEDDSKNEECEMDID